MGKNNKIRRAQKKLNIARKQKKLKGKQLAKEKRSLGPTLQMLPNPFKNLSDAERKQVIHELAENSEKKY